MDIGSTDKIDTGQLDAFLTVAEVAEHYRTSERTVQRWIREGKLRAIRNPGGRSYRISRSEIEASA